MINIFKYIFLIIFFFFFYEIDNFEENTVYIFCHYYITHSFEQEKSIVKFWLH